MLGGNFATAFLIRGAVSAWVAEAFAHSRSECFCYFLRQLGRGIGRRGDVGQVAGFEKSAFAPGRSQDAGFQAIAARLAAKSQGCDSVRDGLERSHLGRLEAVVLVEGG